MPDIELSAGVITYEDTNGTGPIIVLIHGLVTDGSLWRHVVHELRTDYRCIVPTLPFGSHRHPLRPDADLSPLGIGKLQAEFLERLDLRAVTLVGIDAGAFQFTAGLYPERIARLVAVACEAFENIPPGLPGHTVSLAARLPGGINALVQPMRLRWLRSLPMAYGWLAKHQIPHAITDAWLHPLLTQRAIRRDLTRLLRASKKGAMLEAAKELRRFEQPALVVWATEDRVMPRAHGQRLADVLPQGHLIEIADSYTLIPEDQPTCLAQAIRQFILDTPC